MGDYREVGGSGIAELEGTGDSRPVGATRKRKRSGFDEMHLVGWFVIPPAGKYPYLFKLVQRMQQPTAKVTQLVVLASLLPVMSCKYCTVTG